MLFSILVTVYNKCLYISRCLDSIIKQTYQKYETIVLDDGSTDESAFIYDSALVSFDRLVIIHQMNKGVMAARRTALKAVNGDYVIWVDSDDAIDDNMLSLLEENIAKYESDVIIYGYRLINNDQRVVRVIKPLESTDFRMFSSESIGNVRESLVSGNNMNELCTKCVKRSLYDIYQDYSQWYDIRTGEDLFCLFPVFDKAKTVLAIPYQPYRYYIIEDSITHKFESKYYYSYRLIYKRVREYIEKWNIRDDIKLTVLLNQSKMICDLIVLSFFENRHVEFVRLLRDVMRDDLIYFDKSVYKDNKVPSHYHILAYLLKSKCELLIYYYLNILAIIKAIK